MIKIKKNTVYECENKGAQCFFYKKKHMYVFYNVFLFVNLVVQWKYTQNKDLAIF